MEQLVKSCGLAVVDHPNWDEIERRYVAGRSDGLLPWTLETLLSAVVP
jgi:hypothetical protein